MDTTLASPSTSKLKVAVCLSGIPRNYEKTFPYLKKHLLDVCSPDIFYAGYHETNGKTDDKLFETYQPKKHLIRDYDATAQQEIDKKFLYYQPFYMASSINIRRFKSQFYNIYLSNELKKEYEIEQGFKYDIVIRCRTDCYFNRDLSLDELHLSLDGSVVIPDRWDFKEVSRCGVSDSFAFSTSASMDIFSMAFFCFAKYNREDRVMFHPETLLGYHLAKTGLKRIAIKTPYEFETPEGVANERYNYNRG